MSVHVEIRSPSRAVHPGLFLLVYVWVQVHICVGIYEQTHLEARRQPGCLSIPSIPNSFRKGLFDLELLKQVWLVGQ